MNTDTRPLQKLTFTLEASFDYKPVLNTDGKPVRIELSTKDPLAPGAASTIVEGLELSKAESIALGGACLQLKGIRVTYADQTTLDVAASHVSAYLTPQMQPQAICTPFAPEPRSPTLWSPPFPPLPYCGQWRSQYVNDDLPGYNNRGRSPTAPNGDGSR